MSLGVLLDQVREYYLTRLQAARDEAETRGRVIAEAALVDADGRMTGVGELDLPARVDLVVLPEGGAPESLLVDTEGLLSFAPARFAWDGGLEVEVHPFRWNGCPVVLLGGRAELEPLATWFRRWFEERGAPGPWLEVLHTLAESALEPGRVEVMVDLGSAPVVAVEGLFDAAVALGCRSVRLGQPAPAPKKTPAKSRKKKPAKRTPAKSKKKKPARR